jgi:hypothetical protein
VSKGYRTLVVLSDGGQEDTFWHQPKPFLGVLVWDSRE